MNTIRKRRGGCPKPRIDHTAMKVPVAQSRRPAARPARRRPALTPARPAPLVVDEEGAVEDDEAVPVAEPEDEPVAEAPADVAPEAAAAAEPSTAVESLALAANAS